MTENRQNGDPPQEPLDETYESWLPGESGMHEAFRVAGVVSASFVVLGLGLGILIASLGLPWWVAPLISLTVYAGSVEFLLVGMIATGAPLASIATTTFLVNSRHLVYGLSFPLHRVKGIWGKLYAAYALTDENFALNVGPRSHSYRSSRILWISLLLHLSWATGSTLGVFIGASFLSHLEGVDFVMTALFIILAIDAYRAQKDNITALIALASAVVAMVFFPESMLTVALLLFVALLIIRHCTAGLGKRTDSRIQNDGEEERAQ